MIVRVTKTVRRVLLSALLAVSFLAPAAQAQAAQCTWQRTELPVPSPYTDTFVNGVAGDYVAGMTYTDEDQKLVLWRHGRTTVLPVPTNDPKASVRIAGVNRFGMIAGGLAEHNSDGTMSIEAFVTKPDGTSRRLPHPAGAEAVPAGINDFGDVVGHLWADFTMTNVVWPGWDHSKYRPIDATGYLEGVDNLGTVVTHNGEVVSAPGIKWHVQAPPGAIEVFAEAFENNRILGEYRLGDKVQGVVWNVDGSVDYLVDRPGGVSVNRLGTVVGYGPTIEFQLWRKGIADTNLPSPAPAVRGGQLFVDNDDVVSGNYRSGRNAYAAQWRCA
jgi:hypothetical protein